MNKDFEQSANKTKICFWCCFFGVLSCAFLLIVQAEDPFYFFIASGNGCFLVATVYFWFKHDTERKNIGSCLLCRKQKDQKLEKNDELNVWRESCCLISTEGCLSPREREVFELLARGRNTKHIARTLTITISTTKTHISNIYRKLNIHSTQELLDLIENKTALS